MQQRYNEGTTEIGYLQGREHFPTGGKVREPKGMNRCDSGTDSIVWMVEDVRFDLLRRLKDIFFRVIF